MECNTFATFASVKEFDSLMSDEKEKPLSKAIADRRATPSFDGSPLPSEDLRQILEAGLAAPSSYNLQPWRFIVLRDEAQLHRLRVASYNQAKIEESSVVIVACGDADGWRSGDLDEMLRMGKSAGMPESYAAQARTQIPDYLASRQDLTAWLNRHVMISVTHMMLMAEVLGYDTAPMEGFEEAKVRDLLRLPLSYTVVCLLAIGRRKGADKFAGGRFSMSRTVFGEEYGKPVKL